MRRWSCRIYLIRWNAAEGIRLFSLIKNFATGGEGSRALFTQSLFRKLLLTIGSVMVAVGLVSRMALRARYLGWDQIQFVLGTHDFNVIKHQPHPPGYILFVGILRVVLAVVGDASLSVTLTATLFTCASSILLFLFAMKLYGDRNSAILAAFFWLASPLVWFSDLTGAVYSAGAFASLATAYGVYSFWKNPGERSAILAAGVFAASAGIRQDQTVFLAPLCLFPFLRSRACRRYFPLSLIVFVLGFLTWYIPTVEYSGGYKIYSALVRAQFLQSAKITSIFFGAALRAHVGLLARLTYELLLGLLPVLFLMAFRMFRTKPPEPPAVVNKEKAAFLAVWTTPFLLFFGLVHMGNMGFSLPCLPPLLLLAVRWVVLRRDAAGREPSFLVPFSLLSVVVSTVFFFGARELPFSPPSRSGHDGISGASYLLPGVYGRIRFSDEVTKAYFTEIRKTISGQPIALVHVSTTSHDPCSLDWRKLMYYFPGIPVFDFEDLDKLRDARPREIYAKVGFDDTASGALLHFADTHANRNVARLSIPGRARTIIIIPSAISTEVLVESDAAGAMPLVPGPAEHRLQVCKLLLYDSIADSHPRVRIGENVIEFVP